MTDLQRRGLRSARRTSVPELTSYQLQQTDPDGEAGHRRCAAGERDRASTTSIRGAHALLNLPRRKASLSASRDHPNMRELMQGAVAPFAWSRGLHRRATAALSRLPLRD